MALTIQPVLYIAAGPSGSGKSTTFEMLNNLIPSIAHFSWDNLRLDWYDPTDYNRAWKLAGEDPTFMSRAWDEFNKHIQSQSDVFVDNTNLTPKRRKPFIDAAKKAGYLIVGIKFDVELDELISRQSTRGDKCIPDRSVIQQYESYKYPTLVEGFDEIVTPDLIPIEYE
jgi:predicted ABC-type ATPase